MITRLSESDLVYSKQSAVGHGIFLSVKLLLSQPILCGWVGLDLMDQNLAFHLNSCAVTILLFYERGQMPRATPFSAKKVAARWLASQRGKRCLTHPPPLLLYGSEMESGVAGGGTSAGSDEGAKCQPSPRTECVLDMALVLWDVRVLAIGPNKIPQQRSGPCLLGMHPAPDTYVDKMF